MMKNDINQLLSLLKRKNKALSDAALALEQASARLDLNGRDKLAGSFKFEAEKAKAARMELPCLTLGGKHGNV